MRLTHWRDRHNRVAAAISNAVYHATEKRVTTQAYYLTAIHEQLPLIQKVKLQRVG
jgi:hypothetical protein